MNPLALILALSVGVWAAPAGNGIPNAGRHGGLPPAASRNPLTAALAGSLAVHALALGALTMGRSSAPPPPKASIEVTLVERSKQIATPDHRVVRTSEVEPSKTAAPDAKLGRQTQTVDRETVKSGNSPGTGGSGAARKAPGKPIKLSDLGVPLSKPVMGRPGRGGDPAEHLDGAREGAQTMLNTKEFVYFSYYERVRKSLELAWNRALKAELEKMARQGRALREERDHLTKVVVTLDRTGTVKKVVVIEDSGVRELDRAAVDAFNAAGPYPNPPKGLIDKDGRVEIRWDFILKT